MLNYAKDDIPPQITILSPSNKSTYQSSVTVVGSVTDKSTGEGNLGEVISATYEVIGTQIKDEITVENDGSFSVQVPTVNLSGEIEIKLIAIDWQNNESEYILTLVDDEKGPVINISSPSDNSYYAKTVIVEGTVANSEEDHNTDQIKSLSYEVLSSSIRGNLTFENGTFIFQFVTTNLEGTQIVRITAEDWNENISEKDLILIDGGSDIPTLSAQSGNKSVILEWEEIPNTIGYTLYYSTNGALPSESVGITEPNVTSPYHLSDLKNGNLHVFLLKAEPEPGLPESYSDYVRAIPLSEYDLAPKVTGEYRQIRVTWNNVSGADEFSVYRSVSPDQTGYNISGPISGNEYIDTEVNDDTWYYYRVEPTLSGSVMSTSNGGQTIPFGITPEMKGSSVPPDWAYDVEISGNYAYVTDGYSKLSIINIENPMDPEEVGFYPCDPSDMPSSVCVDGSYAYVACKGSGIMAINIENKTDPQPGESYDTDGTAYGIAVRNGYAYVADYNQGLQVFNLSSISSGPVGSYPISGYAIGVTIQGDYAYVPELSYGFEVFDLNAEYGSSSIATYDADYARDIAVSGDYAYAANWNYYTLQTFDLTGASGYTPVGTYSTPDQAMGVSVSGPYAYVSNLDYGIQIINISDPALPVFANSVSTSGDAYNVAVTSSYIYAAANNAGLQIIDNANPAIPSLAATYPPTSTALDVSIEENYALVSDCQTGDLLIFDLSDPGGSPPAGTGNLAQFSYGLDTGGGYAFVANGDNGLKIFDISNLPTAGYCSTYNSPGTAMDVSVNGAFAFLADNTAGVQIIDVSDPENPSLYSNFNTQGNAQSVTANGSFAYITVGSELQVVDISNISHPVLAGKYDTGNGCNDVEVRNAYAYIADGTAGLTIVNIDNPTSPDLVSTYDMNTTGESIGVTVCGHYVLLADASEGLKIINVSDPKNPFLAGEYDTDGSAHNVSVCGSYAYVADYTEGLQVINLLGGN